MRTQFSEKNSQMAQSGRMNIPTEYRIKATLADGYYGPTVLTYKVRADDCSTTNTSEVFVLKFLLKEAIGDETAVRNFISGIKKANSLKIRYLVKFTRIMETDRYIILERQFIDCLNLTSYIENGVPHDNQTVFRIWRHICRVCQQMHHHNIFPNFIKPSNVFVKDNNNIFVTDVFSPPMHFDPTLHRLNPYDVGFLPPEFFQGCKTHEKSFDIWSLGLMLKFMMIRELPWSTQNIMTMLKEIKSGKLPERNQMVHPELAKVLNMLLIKEPESRIDIDTLVSMNSEIVINAPDKKQMIGLEFGAVSETSKFEKSCLKMSTFHSVMLNIKRSKTDFTNTSAHIFESSKQPLDGLNRQIKLRQRSGTNMQKYKMHTGSSDLKTFV